MPCSLLQGTGSERRPAAFCVGLEDGNPEVYIKLEMTAVVEDDLKGVENSLEAE